MTKFHTDDYILFMKRNGINLSPVEAPKLGQCKFLAFCFGLEKVFYNFIDFNLFAYE